MTFSSAARPTRVRYVVVALATAMSLLLYLDRFCISFAERFIKDDLRLSDRQISVFLSAFFLSYALAQVPAGWFSDRHGARAMLTLYIVAWSLFTGLMGLTISFVLLVVFRLGCGVAQAGAYPTGASLLSRWMPFAARGLASSIVTVGGRVGAAAAPVITAYLMVQLAGWRAVMLIYGAVGMVVAGAFWMGFRNRPKEHPACNPAEIALIEEGRPASAVIPSGQAGALPLRPMLRSRSLWLISIAQFGTNFGWTFLLTWLLRYLTEVHRVPVLDRGWLAGLPLLIGSAGMLGGGWLTDRLTRRLGLRWGRALPMAASRFGAMAAFLACLLLDSAWGVTLALSLVAFATDVGTPAVWAYKQDVGGRYVGSMLGWGNMWGNLGAALSPLVLNLVVEAWGWSGVFVACAGAFLLAGVTALGVDARVPIVPETA
jgi:sugar phosphate permease